MSRLCLFVAGFWFAELQVSSMFLLQTYYTASIEAYLVLITAWLSGAVLGVWILDSRASFWVWLTSILAACLLYGVWIFQVGTTIEMAWALLFLCAVPAGHLFQQELGSWTDVGKMFAIESVGFLLGILSSTLLLMGWGLDFCRIVPLQGLVPLTMFWSKNRMAAKA